MDIINVILAFYLTICVIANVYIFVNINKNNVMAFQTYMQLKCMFFVALLSKILQFVLLCTGYTMIVYIIVPLDFLGGMLGFSYVEHNINQIYNVSPLICSNPNSSR